jgi:hypothetical protein
MMCPSDWFIDDEPTTRASEGLAARVSASFADARDAPSNVRQTQASTMGAGTAVDENQRWNSTRAVCQRR